MKPVYTISAEFSGSPGSFVLTGASSAISAILQQVAIDSRLRALIESSSSAISPNMDDVDYLVLTSLEEDFTLQNPSSANSFDEGRKLLVRITDSGVSRAISYGDKYRGTIAALPSTTNPNKAMYLGFLYNSTDDMWDLVAFSRQS